MDQVRRQVFLLTEQELIDQAAWEFCSDEEDVEGQDEATVRPVDAADITDEAGVFIFAADVVFADGTSATGYRYSGNTNEFGTIQPCVVTASGQVGLWLGMLRFIDIEAVKKDCYAKFGKTAEAVFPLTFFLRVPIEGRMDEVLVNGFMGLDDRQRVISFR